MMNENNYFLTLSTPLPEDIQKLKWCGQFEQAKRMIGLRLKRDLPRVMKDRLTLELEIIREKGPIGVGKAVARNQDGKITTSAEMTFAIG